MASNGEATAATESSLQSGGDNPPQPRPQQQQPHQQRHSNQTHGQQRGGHGQQRGGHGQQRGGHGQQQRPHQQQGQQNHPQHGPQHGSQRSQQPQQRGPASTGADYDGPEDFDGPDEFEDDLHFQPGGIPQQPPPLSPPFECSGVLELPPNSDGRIRQFSDGLVESDEDPWVPYQLVQQLGLRPAQRIVAEARLRRSKKRRRGGRSVRPLVENVLTIEGLTPEEYTKRRAFADYTALDPSPRISLEYKGCPPSCRLIDLFCPIGFGTRGLIVAPPKAGKTMLLQNIAYGIKRNHPNIELIALLIDERPEEVTDFKRNVPAQVLASSNDQDLERHLSLGILAIERAKRLVEAGRDVVVLLDSLTRLGRAFNNSRRYGSSGRTMSGGVDSRALEVPKQLFGAARKCEEGGSLTIIATCLVDTGSRADQVIFEEFKGTGNMELILDRSISEKRIFPAINLAASGTRKEHLMMSERELKTITALRRRLLAVPPHAQIEQLLAACQRFETNDLMVGGAS